MYHFRLIQTIDPELRLNLLREIEQSNLWLWDTGRQALAVQAETHTIPLRGADPNPDFTGNGCDVHCTRDILIHKFPILKSVLYRFNPIARAMIVRLAPWGQVYKHFDYGPYYDCRDRFHLVVQSQGSDLTAGDESCLMHQGELWWFNNSVPHQAFNYSDEWRIHVIFDTDVSTYKDKWRSECDNQ